MAANCASSVAPYKPCCMHRTGQPAFGEPLRLKLSRGISFLHIFQLEPVGFVHDVITLFIESGYP